MLKRWDTCKDKLQHYRRRQPDKSVLYQLVYHGRDDLLRVWAERFQSGYGVLRDEVTQTFDAYLNCGILRARCGKSLLRHLQAFADGCVLM